MDVSYLGSSTVFSQDFYPFLEKEDFQTVLQLFKKLAVSSTNELVTTQQRESPLLSNEKVSLKAQSSEKTEEFVKKYSHIFRRTCNTGFPFSVLDPIALEKGFKKALESGDSVITHLLKQDNSVELTEEELERKFGEVVKNLNIIKMQGVCSELRRDYREHDDNRAGYCLLWLIKYLGGCSFEIPSEKTFDKSTLKTVLSNFFLGDTMRCPLNFINLLWFKDFNYSNYALYNDFLENNSLENFYSLTRRLLISKPMTTWPNKTYVIKKWLMQATAKGKQTIAEMLKSSEDNETSELGGLILQFLKTTSKTVAIEYFYKLTELLPGFDSTNVEDVLDKPMEAFLQQRFGSKKDPDFTKRLCFNGKSREVFVSGDLMIGVYGSTTSRALERVPDYLLAFNMKTERMEWGIPLIPLLSKKAPSSSLQISTSFTIPQMELPTYHLTRVGEDIALYFMGEKKVYLINSNSGEIKASIKLPHKKQNKSDRLHLTPNNFGYQMVNRRGGRKLIGGEIGASKLKSTFEVDAPEGGFLPLSTYVGFLKNWTDELTLFGSTGKSVKIDCLSAKAYGDKLYLIEPNPSDEKTCKLTIRTMTADDRVVTAPEKTIILTVTNASIGGLCDNKQLMILFEEDFSKKTPIFVHLDREEIFYSKHEISLCGTEIINTATGEVWNWEESSKEIWKTSFEKRESMGHLESGRRTNFVHIDESSNLYFIERFY